MSNVTKLPGKAAKNPPALLERDKELQRLIEEADNATNAMWYLIATRCPKNPDGKYNDVTTMVRKLLSDQQTALTMAAFHLGVDLRNQITAP